MRISCSLIFFYSLLSVMGNMLLKIDDYSISVENSANISLDEEIILHVRKFIRTGLEMIKRTKRSVAEIEGTIVYPSIFKIRYNVNDNRVELRNN